MTARAAWVGVPAWHHMRSVHASCHPTHTPPSPAGCHWCAGGLASGADLRRSPYSDWGDAKLSGARRGGSAAPDTARTADRGGAWKGGGGGAWDAPRSPHGAPPPAASRATLEERYTSLSSPFDGGGRGGRGEGGWGRGGARGLGGSTGGAADVAVLSPKRSSGGAELLGNGKVGKVRGRVCGAVGWGAAMPGSCRRGECTHSRDASGSMDTFPGPRWVLTPSIRDHCTLTLPRCPPLPVDPPLDAAGLQQL